jgi:uncharacterized protein YgbK (DUF1537 family)
MTNDLAELQDVARVIAVRIRQDAGNIGDDIRHPRLMIENHARDLDRLADKLAEHAAQAQEQIDKWIKAYAYAPDDIVLGSRGLEDDQLPGLHGLLDLARPGWRSIFAGDS